MGALIAKLVFLDGKETVELSQIYKSFWDIPMNDIDGQRRTMGEICRGKKAVMFVNVATK